MSTGDWVGHFIAHARRWQTKEGTYRIKGQLPPDVRDNGDIVMADSSADLR